RMPMSFAVKMWGWTRIGARVIITPGEVTPAEFSHPLLTTHRPERAPVATEVLTANAGDAMAQRAVLSTATNSPAAGEPQTATPEPAADPIKVDTDNTKDADVTATAAVKSDAGTAKPEDEPQSADSATDVTATARNPSQPSPASDETTEPMAISALKRSDRIAVFVSRKDSKIYVRQNFAPLFDAPITITPSDRPLGTHVFTAEADKGSKDDFRWSVVSLPAMTHGAQRIHVRKNSSHEQTARGAAKSRPAPVPDSAADALNRISLPENVMAKIADSLSTGDSIVVSDQGIAGGETGQGTDFIVKLQ
ncbi:MAG TPA: L,D-transpeptidase, partial [Nitrobacter sp.]|nr:L,D-transpeptidase [Nitrobacter sp.]